MDKTFLSAQLSVSPSWTFEGKKMIIFHRQVTPTHSHISYWLVVCFLQRILTHKVFLVRL